MNFIQVSSIGGNTVIKKHHEQGKRRITVQLR